MAAETATLRGARAPDRHGRVRRIIGFVHGLTLVTHVVFVLGLGTLIESTTALLLGVGTWLVTAGWLGRLGPDRRRPLARTRLVDEPLFVHWGACVYGFALLPIVALLGLSLGLSLSHVALAAYGGGAVLAAYGVWGRRRWVRMPEIEVTVPGLPRAFDGYRIAHLTDLHIGSFDRLERGLEWVRMANSRRPDMVAVTGDLVTSGTTFYRDVANVLGRATSADGVYVVLGNHDQWDDRALERAVSAWGPTVLRNESRTIRRGDAAITVAGVDDPYTGKDDLARCLETAPDGAACILLSHYPHLFEDAARRGVSPMLSGHTHGGQFGLPFLADRFNVARFTGQRQRGLFRSGDARLFVSAGLGTTGPPMRLGVAPEIPLLILRCGVPSAS